MHEKFSPFLSHSEKTKLNLESRCSSLRKHLSKSASELSCKECTTSATNESITPFPSPKRAKSAANPNVAAAVLQRTSGFLNNLKVQHSSIESLTLVAQTTFFLFLSSSSNRVDGLEGEAKNADENHQDPVHCSTMTVIIVTTLPTIAIALWRPSNRRDIEPPPSQIHH